MSLTLETTKDGLNDRLGAATCQFLYTALNGYVDFSKVRLSCYQSVLTVYLPYCEGDEVPGDPLRRFSSMRWHEMIAAIAARMGDLVTGIVIKGEEFEMKPSNPRKYIRLLGECRIMARRLGYSID